MKFVLEEGEVEEKKLPVGEKKVEILLGHL